MLVISVFSKVFRSSSSWSEFRHRLGSWRAASGSWLATCLAKALAHSLSATTAAEFAAASALDIPTPSADNPPTARALPIIVRRLSLGLAAFFGSLFDLGILVNSSTLDFWGVPKRNESTVGRQADLGN